MEALSSDLIYQAVKILGAQPGVSDETEDQLRALVRDDITVRRLADVIPEAFGLVLASHLPGADKMVLPDTFCAQDEDGEWEPFAMRCEPIFVVAANIAQHTFHNGPRALLKNLSEQSSLLSAISQALYKTDTLDGTTVGPPSFFGLPATLYRPAASPATP
ncbi:hypothetical protein IGS59_08470 [Janthinobacterium sp. GW460P]|uniref:hypothetical protein n=1 Tax=unclassified Janthinobacterium TaxID=2610881 RepID=UPI000A32413D|nr:MULTISPECIES: hypothetical protein [unclassified Janthinobacterium]MCC7702268.1 hypothetical protein [Janthinobacterium sp. GW460P]MCC7707776.1 hypothetical protein [Janthinobacterium sp. GW460W]